jgi:hypothetical protein
MAHKINNNANFVNKIHIIKIPLIIILIHFFYPIVNKELVVISIKSIV